MESHEPDEAVIKFTPEACLAANAFIPDGHPVQAVLPLLKLPYPKIRFEFGDNAFIVEGEATSNGFWCAWTRPEFSKPVFSAFEVRPDGFYTLALWRNPAAPSEAMVVANEEQAGTIRGSLIRLLAYFNCPQLLELEVVEFSRLNKKRRKLGRPEKPAYTVVRPSRVVREYLSGKPPGGSGEMPKHWVRGHWRIVWCGPKDQPQRPEPRWVLPFTRGNPDNGTRKSRYLVKENRDDS